MTLATEQTQAHAVINGVYEGWNTHDVAGFVAGYADAATATLPGAHLGGKAAIRTTMTAALEGPLKGSHVCHEVTNPDYISLTTWVLALEDGACRIQAYHECAAGAP